MKKKILLTVLPAVAVILAIALILSQGQMPKIKAADISELATAANEDSKKWNTVTEGEVRLASGHTELHLSAETGHFTVLNIETSQSEKILLDGHAVSARFVTVADKYVGPRYEESVSNEKLNNVVYEVNKIDTIVLILCDNGNIVWANRQAKFFVDLQNNYEDNESFFKDEKFSTIELRKMPEYKM